jgi:hypothetical protein
VHELRISAHRDDIAAHPHEPLVLLCQSSELGGSDEGEIGGIEEEDRPSLLAELFLQAEFPEVPFGGFVRGQLEVRHFLAQHQSMHRL